MPRNDLALVPSCFACSWLLTAPRRVLIVTLLGEMHRISIAKSRSPTLSSQSPPFAVSTVRLLLVPDLLQKFPPNFLLKHFYTSTSRIWACRSTKGVWHCSALCNSIVHEWLQRVSLSMQATMIPVWYIMIPSCITVLVEFSLMKRVYKFSHTDKLNKYRGYNWHLSGAIVGT